MNNNLYIPINETYFGKSVRTEALEYAFSNLRNAILADQAPSPPANVSSKSIGVNKNINNLLNKFSNKKFKNNDKLKHYKYRLSKRQPSKEISELEKFFDNNARLTMDYDESKFSDMLKSAIEDVSIAIQSCFGFDRVKVIYSPTPILNAATCVVFNDNIARSRKGIPVNILIREGFLDKAKTYIKHAISKTQEWAHDRLRKILVPEYDGTVIDNNGKLLTVQDRLDALIVDNTGIRINTDKYSTTMFLYLWAGLFLPLRFGDKFISLDIPEITAAILHEIGHNFSRLILPSDFVLSHPRIDEKFADRFASLYGYSKQLMSGLYKMTMIGSKQYVIGRSINYELSNNKDYLYSGENNIDPKTLDKAMKDLVKRNTRTLNITYKFLFVIKSRGIDEHPNLYSRMKSNIDQLNSERRSRTLSQNKRNQLDKDYNASKDYLNYLYNSDQGSELDNRIRDVILKDISHDEKSEEERNKDYNHEYITDVFDKLYKNRIKNKRKN